MDRSGGVHHSRPPTSASGLTGAYHSRSVVMWGIVAGLDQRKNLATLIRATAEKSVVLAPGRRTSIEGGADRIAGLRRAFGVFAELRRPYGAKALLTMKHSLHLRDPWLAHVSGRCNISRSRSSITWTFDGLAASIINPMTVARPGYLLCWCRGSAGALLEYLRMDETVSVRDSARLPNYLVPTAAIFLTCARS